MVRNLYGIETNVRQGETGLGQIKPSAAIRDFLKKTYPNTKFNFDKYPLYGVPAGSKGTEASNLYNKIRERVTRKFRPEIYEEVKKEKRITAAEASFGKDGLNVDQRAQLNGVKAGILYQQAVNDIVKSKGRGLSTAEKNELRFTLQNNKKFMKLINDAGFDNVNDFMNSDYTKVKANSLKIKAINEGKKMISSQEIRDYDTDDTPRGKKLKQSIIARKKLLNDWLNKNIKDKKQIKQIKTTGDFIETREVRDKPIDEFRTGQTARYRKYLNAGFSSDKVRKIWNAKPGVSKEFHRPTLINNSLGIGDNATLRFNRSHFFPIMAAGELKNKNLLAPNTFYSDRFTYRPAYINQLQKFFYDQPVASDVGKYLRGTITKQELDKSLATRAKNFTDTFDIDVDQLKLNKNGKFEFVNKSRPPVTGGTFKNRIPLIRNAEQELKNTINIQGAGLLDAKEIEIAKLKFPDVNVDSVAKDFFNPKIPQETYELLKQKPGLNKRIMEVRNQDIKSGAATQSTNKSFLFKSFMDKASPFLRKVPGSSVALAPIDFFLMTASGAPMNEALLSAGSYFLKDPLIGKAVNVPLALLAQQREYKETGEFKPIFNMQAGEDKLKGLIDKVKEKFGADAPIGTADEVPEPESAERRKMFEEANERFGDTNELEISDIDNPFMAAMGGRVGFKDGSPKPIESEATIDQALAALNSSEVRKQFLYDTSPMGKLDKSIFGKDDDRSLAQQFNTQFLDPRAYPYYAQKGLRGAANIPELAFRFPFAVTGLARDLITGQEGKLERFGETIDPKLTRKIAEGGIGELLGISSAQIEAAEEKRTNPQKVTGEFLQFGAEVFGPATPYFLIKKFPKLFKQLKDLGASGTAVDKINKEIENKVAQQGVDQTRRDIVLSIGAGGAVAFLKYLGLDFLTKAPKAAKVTEEIVTKGGTPKYFFDFVGLIKSKGKDITDKASTLERQKVYDYNGYELTEDISTGKISIRKDTEGGGSYPIGDGEYETVEGIIRKEEINYEPPETILDDAGKPKRVPDNYEENTLLPDADGDAGDVSAGLDSIDDILDLLAKDGKKYSLDELKEMGINPEAIGDDFLLRILKDPSELKIDKIRTKGDKRMDQLRLKITGRSDKAGGGIMKIAGDDSGPPPKSGPTPHGLPYVAKNVRPIKERK
jgi:hypothetical protein